MIFTVISCIFIAVITFCMKEIRMMSESDGLEESTGIAQTSSNTVDGEQ